MSAAERLLPSSLGRLLASMPKAELHLHLDGSLQVETALELARTRHVEAPTTLEGMRDVLVAPPRTASQAELLRAFDLPIALLQDAEALERVAAELVESKVADGVRYLEIRWAPLLHIRRGLDPGDGIRAVMRGAIGAARRAADAGPTVDVRLICTALRTHDPDANRALARVAAASRDDGLTGWDLAGPEAAAPDPLVHRRAFDEARGSGLRITLHAGEWGGAPQVRRALALEPERIAHGAAAIEDPALVVELVRRGITLDLCPTSNVQAGLFATVADHPLARLHRAGVSVTLSTDDTTVSEITLREEYRRAVEIIGLSPAELWAIDRRALDVAFADAPTLERHRRAFDAWASVTPMVD